MKNLNRCGCKLRTFSQWTDRGLVVAMTAVLFCIASSAYAQAGPILRVGKWVGEQLIGYGAGKAIDKLTGLDCEEELQQIEASLSLQIKADRADKEKLKAELAAVQSQLKILDSLIRSKPTSIDVDQYRRLLAKDLDKVLLVQEKQDQRLTLLEKEVADLTTQLRRLQTGSRGAEEARDSPAPVRQSRAFNVHVEAQEQWTSTGIALAPGDSITIQAGGSAATVPGTYSGPKGQQYRCDASCTFPSGYYGQLVGKIGTSGQPFAVGERMNFFASSSGELFLAVNDCCDWSDNDGALTASVLVNSTK